MSFKIFTIIGHIFDYGPSRGDRTGNFASRHFLQMHACEVNLLLNQMCWSRRPHRTETCRELYGMQHRKV